MLDWAAARHRLLALRLAGRHADVDFGDMLDYLASDARTRAILLYIESVEAPRKFMSAARAAARNKPVIVVKAGPLAARAAGRGLAHRRAGRLRHRVRRRHPPRRHAARGHAAGPVHAAETLARYRGSNAGATRRAADTADQRRRRRRAGGRRAGAGRRARWPTERRRCWRALDAFLPPPGRTATRWTSSATRRPSATCTTR
jgi:hypothetical protein